MDNNKDRNTPTLLKRDKEIRQIVCRQYCTFILKESGELFAFGCNDDGQLGLGDYIKRSIPTLVIKDKGIRQIICGGHHTLILKISGELFAFGCNHSGQLGLDYKKNILRLTLTMMNENIVSINGTIIEKIKWNPNIYLTLSTIKKIKIKNFLLVCHYYKKIYGIYVVKYMRHAIINALTKTHYNLFESFQGLSESLKFTKYMISQNRRNNTLKLISIYFMTSILRKLY